MLRSGLAQGPRQIREEWLQVVKDHALMPRPPTVAELAEVAACTTDHAQKLQQLLVQPWLEPARALPSAVPSLVRGEMADAETHIGEMRTMVRPSRHGFRAVPLQHPEGPAPSADVPRRYAVARRLSPCIRNLVLPPPPPPPPQQHRMLTRSKSGPLMQGILETDSAERHGRRRGHPSSSSGLTQAQRSA